MFGVPSVTARPMTSIATTFFINVPSLGSLLDRRGRPAHTHSRRQLNAWHRAPPSAWRRHETICGWSRTRDAYYPFRPIPAGKLASASLFGSLPRLLTEPSVSRRRGAAERLPERYETLLYAPGLKKGGLTTREK